MQKGAKNKIKFQKNGLFFGQHPLVEKSPDTYIFNCENNVLLIKTSATKALMNSKYEFIQPGLLVKTQAVTQVGVKLGILQRNHVTSRHFHFTF